MAENLMDMTTGKLLEKFGGGHHKPGSGSASALQGMLAAQMVRTVINLTCDPKRRNIYGKYVPQLQKINEKIEIDIYPALEKLFVLDSQQFDKVIQLREARDKEIVPKKKKELAIKAKDALLTSTETPLNIAELCLEVAHLGGLVFDNGFKSARGDSAVALNSAIAAVVSCLSIIELNLITLPFNLRTEKIRERTSEIKTRFDKISSKTFESLNILQKESLHNREFQSRIAKFKVGNLSDGVKLDSEIETIVRDLQNTLWMFREKIWAKQPIETALDVLRPELVLKKILDYDFLNPESLGFYTQNDELFEIAGIIHKAEKLVQVSANFPLETQNFTAAHELGHAILHRQPVLHRDKPIDGSQNKPRSREELQADKFATYFLMPAKMVEDVFLVYFQTPKFTINVNNVLAIRAGSIDSLRQKCKDRRGLARLLASSDYYAGNTFNPLAKVFKVSVETMAIRLEELSLLEF